MITDARTKYFSLKYFLHQYDSLLAEHVSAAYGLAMANTLPALRHSRDKYANNYTSLSEQLDAAGKVIKFMTGMETVEAVREATQEIETVIQAYEAVQQELTSRVQLNTLMLDVATAFPEGNEETRTKLTKSIEEIEELSLQATKFAEHAEYLASSMKFRDPTEVQPVDATVSLIRG